MPVSIQEPACRNFAKQLLKQLKNKREKRENKMLNLKLKNSCHAELGSVSQAIKIKCKKAAMFGLDARIALAIFGALSVITGAALFSAIQNARIVAIKTDLDEMAKAFEAYWLDTGQLPSRFSTDQTSNNYHTFKAADLVDDPGVAGWKGPYLGYKRHTSIGLSYPKFANSGFNSIDKDANLGGNYYHNYSGCKVGKKCTLMIGIFNNVDDTTFHALDDMIDGGDGDAAGRLRGYYIDDDDDKLGLIYYMPGIPLPNPIPDPAP